MNASIHAARVPNTQAVIQEATKLLPRYLAKAEDVSADYEPLAWWKKHAGQLPRWSSAVCKVAPVQLTSVVFHVHISLIKTTRSIVTGLH